MCGKAHYYYTLYIYIYIRIYIYTYIYTYIYIHIILLIVTYTIYCFVIEDVITSCRAVTRQEGEKRKQVCRESKEPKKGSWPHSPVLRL